MHCKLDLLHNANIDDMCQPDLRHLIGELCEMLPYSCTVWGKKNPLYLFRNRVQKHSGEQTGLDEILTVSLERGRLSHCLHVTCHCPA